MHTPKQNQWSPRFRFCTMYYTCCHCLGPTITTRSHKQRTIESGSALSIGRTRSDQRRRIVRTIAYMISEKSHFSDDPTQCHAMQYNSRSGPRQQNPIIGGQLKPVGQSLS